MQSRKQVPHRPKISILMKSDQHKALVEVPIDKEYSDQIIVHREYED
jgi:hypothetical protein